MLLETALEEFSSDESRVLGQPGTIPFSWEVIPGKPRSPPQSECSGEVSAVSSPDLTFQHTHHPSSSGGHSQRVRYYSGELYSHPHRHHSGELLPSKALHRQYSGELLPQSQSRQCQQSRFSGSPAQLDSSLDCTDSPQKFSWMDQLRTERGSSSSSSHLRARSVPDVRYRRRVLSSAVDENLLHGNMSFEGEAVGRVPFEWEMQPGRHKSHQTNVGYQAGGSRNGAGGALTSDQEAQLPPARLVIIRESDQAECSNSSSSRNAAVFPPDGRRLQQQFVRNQQGVYSGPPSSSEASGPTPQQQPMHLMVYPGDVIRISRKSSFQTSTNHSRQDSSHCSVDIEVEKFYEDESPVSTLERLPSPAEGHENDENLSPHGSPVDTSRRGSAARPNSSASASPITDTRISVDSSACSSSREGVNGGGHALRCLPSFHSSSLHSSAPAVSNSSSSNFMASCLMALEVALHSDRDEEEEEEEERERERERVRRGEDDVLVDDDHDGNSDRHDDSSLSLDESAEQVHLHGIHGGARFLRGSSARVHHQPYEGPELRRWGSFNHRWAGSNSQLEPEYHTMDFKSENGEDRSGRLSTATVSSHSHFADRASSDATRSTQEIDVFRPRDLYQLPWNDPRSSLDEYSWRDRRFLQDHSRCAEEKADDICSDNMSSDYNLSLAGRHQEVYWDDQQSDMNSERAEEVVRGAVDGLRFTYSPVSSAFVFTRPPNSSPFENDELPENRVVCHSPPNTVDDTEISQRFSISLDYATSICSEDSLPYSIARSSDVTELGLSRAESWSRVQRGASFAAAAAPQHYPSALLDHRRGYEVVVEESGGDFYETPENEHLNVDHSDQLTRKRSTKKSGFPTCLPFRSILRNFKIFSPGRSRPGPRCPQCELHKQQSPTNWAPTHQTVQTTLRSHLGVSVVVADCHVQ